MVVGFTADKFPVVTLNPEDDDHDVAGVNSTSVKALLRASRSWARSSRRRPPTPAQRIRTPAPVGTETVLNGQQQIVILAVTTQQSEVIKFSSARRLHLAGAAQRRRLPRPADRGPAPANTVVPVATTGITLKTLVDDYGVLVPELVEAVLPEKARTPSRLLSRGTSSPPRRDPMGR